MPKDTEVSIDFTGGSLTVTPDPAHISADGQVFWTANLQNGQMAEVLFQGDGDQKGPFPCGGGSDNPGRGHYKCAQGKRLQSGRTDKTSGTWKYDVVVRDAQGQTVKRLDPGIVVGDPP